MLVLVKLSSRRFKLLNTQQPAWHCEMNNGLGYEIVTSPDVLVESGTYDDCMTAARQFVNKYNLRLTHEQWQDKYNKIKS